MFFKLIKIVIFVMGGEGGGVLVDWIVDLGEFNGYFVQIIFVFGVVQCIGVIIYYVELFFGVGQFGVCMLVLVLMFMLGDVDVVLVFELMEVGCVVQCGLVMLDCIILFSFMYCVYFIGECIVMGDGWVDSDVLIEYVCKVVKCFVSFDMVEFVECVGSVISVVFFGSLCGIGVLLFSCVQFEVIIECGGVGVKFSLKVFVVGYDQVWQVEVVVFGVLVGVVQFKLV